MKKQAKKKVIVKTQNVFGESRTHFDRSISLEDDVLVGRLNLKTYEKGYQEFSDKEAVLEIEHDLAFTSEESFDTFINRLQHLKDKFIETKKAIRVIQNSKMVLQGLNVNIVNKGE